MENQDHTKANPSGQRGHGVHVCHNCGWPFPNPHPSAKHRRAHKRICGTIEGYKIINSGEKTTHLDNSDDEHLSDEDHKTAGARIVESAISRRSSGGIGSRSNRSTRSEDDAFSDAVTDFADGLGTDNAQVTGENAVAAIAVDGNQMQIVKDLEGQNDLLESSMASQDHISRLINNQDAGLMLHTETEELVLDKTMMQSSTASNLLNADANKSEEKMPNKSLSKLETLSSDIAVEASEAVVFLEELNGETSSSVSADTTAEMTGKKSDCLETQVDSSAEIDSIGKKFSFVKSTDAMDNGNEIVGSPTDFGEPHNTKIEGDQGFYVLKVPKDLPEEHPESMLDDFKDHKGEKFSISPVLNSSHTVYSVQHNSDCVMQESHSAIQSTETGESTYFSAKDDLSENVHAMDDQQKQEVEESKLMVEGVPVEVPVEIDETKAGEVHIWPARSVEIHPDLRKSDSGQGQTVRLLEGQKPLVPCDDSSQNGVPVGAELVGCDYLETCLVTVDLEVYNDKGIRNCDAVDNDCCEVPLYKMPTRNASSPESAYAAPQVNQTISLIGESDVGDSEKTRVENICSNRQEAKDEEEGSIVAMPAKKSSDSEFITPESDDMVHRGMELETKHEHFHMNRISNSVNASNVTGNYSQSGVKEVQSSGEKTIGVGSICPPDMRGMLNNHTNAAVDMSLMLNDNANVDLAQKAAGSLAAMEVHGDAVDSVQSSAAVVEDNCNKEVKVNSMSIHDKSVLVEVDNNLVQQQLASSAIDVLADSSSQTDSLEANWGSISVVASNDSQASAKTEKSSLKPEAAAEGQRSDKSDFLKPPSFTTLVDPSVGDDKKEDAYETQESQNPEGEVLVPMQPAWLTTPTSMANESPGRQRKEEIIAKVTNWSTSKQQHALLKSLLGEAQDDSEPKRPNAKENPGIVPQKDESTVMMNNGSTTAKREEESVSFTKSAAEAAMRDAEKEWNSPARYPANIKREKGKVKNRPYWAPFICCSSSHSS
ncbi:hypothetical protein Nepgr_020463 [Nepenthes gracilis]|uniref:C2H2-type domain-containing protein n=1 Tax=Nepenthes gracilis TaxID=150966 RepID=A0AAD3SX17_NEPGR|nr:hypothetical protein Nepgr_020463 [Nepenthes gracilis]